MAEDLRKTEQQTEQQIGLNLTPMIDVVFQLLIFFILAGKFRVPEGRLDAHLPEGGPTKGQIDKIEDVRITLRNLTGNNKDAPDVLVELGEEDYRGVRILEKGDNTLAMLQKKLSEPQKQGVVIAAEGEIRFHWIMKALNASARAGFEKVSFAAQFETAVKPGSEPVIPLER